MTASDKIRAVLASASATEIGVVLDALEFFAESIADVDEEGEGSEVYANRGELEELLRRIHVGEVRDVCGFRRGGR